ncbi:GH25 family lysozyme [Rhodococcus sp. X156]|uniref:GH25 family lysozyme n=1 Tax=Rhodococcus sp. X156 TaxID=2499145 RepID=UPI0013E403E7|nr:GH25 family lysozyme [Rhodococcus sp. X156]
MTLASAFLLGLTGTAAAQISGVDAASYQHPNGQSINWSAVKNQGGQSFAIVKATEGNCGYVNPYFRNDAVGVKNAGMYLGTYHYARPTVQAGDRYASAEQQANCYLDTIGDYAKVGHLPPALDYEDTGSQLGATDLVNWAQRWLDTVERRTGRVPLVYAARWYWSEYLNNTTQFARYPLWAAHYNTSISAPTLFGGWTSWKIWQYSDTGRIAGINANVDMNRFSGDANALARLAGSSGGGAAPVPPKTADLQVTLQAPLNVAPGQSFTATVTATNHGPASSPAATVSVIPLGAFTTTSTGGGTAAGPNTDLTVPALAAGKNKTFPLTITANGGLGALIAISLPSPADPDFFNNIGFAPVLSF